MKYNLRYARIGIMALLIIAMCGCGPSGATIKGTVTYDGKPVNYGNVAFAVDDKFADAQIKPDGTYEVRNVPFGAAKITVQGAPGKKDMPKPPESNSKGDRRKKKIDGVVLPDIYSSPESSGLKLTIDQSLMEFNINLKKEE